VYDALTVQQRDRFTKEMRASAKHVPTHTILSSFEPEKMGGTTLSMSDYAVLLTVSPTVLQYHVLTEVTTPHAVVALEALKALRRLATAMFYRPTVSVDGEQAMMERPTVDLIQRLGESLMIQVRRLLPFDGKWERPSVHRLLELLYRTLPLAQLGSAVCELIFEKFHQKAKREVDQSSKYSPAEYAMQRWRDIETLSRALSMPTDHGIPQSWLLGQSGKPLKATLFHQLAPNRRTTATTGDRWYPRAQRHTVLETTEEFWRGHASNVSVKFWRKAKHPQRSFTIREGSTVSVARGGLTSAGDSGAGSVGLDATFFVLVKTIGTIDDTVYLACVTWQVPAADLALLGQPALVSIDAAADMVLVRADRVRRLAFVLPCGQCNVLFTKKSGFDFKGG